jgi:hypothetical protein
MKKKLFVIVLIVMFASMSMGCGDTKVIKGTEYDTYGLITKSEKKNPDIEYRVIVGNVVWSVILVETLIAPIYFLCFSLYEPVCLKSESKPKGAL